MCQLDHSQEMTGNRVMAGFIGEVLATHPTRVFTLFVFNRRLESRWNLRISDSKGKCMGNQFQTSCGACWWESSCQQLLGAFQQKKTEFLTLMHRAKGMLRNNSCALIDEAGMLLCYVMFELCLGSFMASCFFRNPWKSQIPVLQWNMDMRTVTMCIYNIYTQHYTNKHLIHILISKHIQY